LDKFEKLRILVLDDSEDSLMSTAGEVGIYVDRNQIFCTTKAAEVQELIEKNSINTMFIDIDLGEKTNGFETAARMRGKFPNVNCIFCTGHPEYALDGYDYDPLDFVIKPINLLKLQRVLVKAADALQPIPKQHSENIAILTEGGFRLVNTDDVVYVEKILRKVIINLKGGDKVVSRYSILQLEKIFDGFDFFRPHQSFLVPIREISDVQAEEGMRGNFNIKLKDSSAKIPLARGKFAQLKEMLAERGIKFI